MTLKPIQLWQSHSYGELRPEEGKPVFPRTLPLTGRGQVIGVPSEQINNEIISETLNVAEKIFGASRPVLLPPKITCRLAHSGDGKRIKAPFLPLVRCIGVFRDGRTLVWFQDDDIATCVDSKLVEAADEKGQYP